MATISEKEPAADRLSPVQEAGETFQITGHGVWSPTDPVGKNLKREMIEATMRRESAAEEPEATVPAKGWLKRQMDRVQADIAAWPSWARRDYVQKRECSTCVGTGHVESETAPTRFYHRDPHADYSGPLPPFLTRLPYADWGMYLGSFITEDGHLGTKALEALRPHYWRWPERLTDGTERDDIIFFETHGDMIAWGSGDEPWASEDLKRRKQSLQARILYCSGLAVSGSNSRCAPAPPT